MTILEMVIIILAIINVILLFAMFYLVITVVKMSTFINQIHVGLATAVSKLFILEQLMNKLGAGFTQFIHMTEGMVDRLTDSGHEEKLYRTTDGKFTARSLDELINKIKQSGDSDRYFSDDELDKLKKLFETDDDTFDEDDD